MAIIVEEPKLPKLGIIIGIIIIISILFFGVYFLFLKNRFL